MAHVFVSYTREDHQKAARIARVIREAGFTTWLDNEDLEPGANWSREVQYMVETASSVVTLWSPLSVESPWVMAETRVGVENETLVPVIIRSLGKKRIPLEFRNHQYVDLARWDGLSTQPEIKRLLNRVQQLMAHAALRENSDESDTLFSVFNEPAATNAGSATTNDEPAAPSMYIGGLTFFISKSLARLQFIPTASGLRILYVPLENGQPVTSSDGYLNLLLPIDVTGSLWVTCRAFISVVSSMDQNIVLQASKGEEVDPATDTLVKLYREKPKGADGALTGEETCWLRLVSGIEEAQRRRIRMGPTDLICLELALRTTAELVTNSGNHNPMAL